MLEPVLSDSCGKLSPGCGDQRICRISCSRRVNQGIILASIVSFRRTVHITLQPLLTKVSVQVGLVRSDLPNAGRTRANARGSGWPRRGRVVGASVQCAPGSCAVAGTAGSLSRAVFAAIVDGYPLPTSAGGARMSPLCGLCLRSRSTLVEGLPEGEGGITIAAVLCVTCLSNVCTERRFG